MKFHSTFFGRSLKREFVWLRFTKIAYFLIAIAAILSIVYSFHAITSWNASVTTWNANVSDRAITIEDIKDALNLPMDAQQIEGQLVVGNIIKYETTRLLSAHAATEYRTAIVGGLSFLTFIILPVIGFCVGILTGGREYKPGYLSIKVDTAPHYVAWIAKIITIFVALVAFLLVLSCMLPISTIIIKQLIGEPTSSVVHDGLFDAIVTEIPQASVLGGVMSFICAAFVTFAFASLGLLVGELFKGRTGVLSIFVAFYYLAPLGNSLDPRNIASAICKNYFWFGGAFNPYMSSQDLLSPPVAVSLLVILTVVSFLLATLVRELRMSSLVFLRKHK